MIHYNRFKLLDSNFNYHNDVDFYRRTLVAIQIINAFMTKIVTFTTQSVSISHYWTMQLIDPFLEATFNLRKTQNADL